MPTQVQFRRGNTSQVLAFTGAVGEIAIDTQFKTISLQDGSTPGGTYLATQAFANAAFATANAAASGATLAVVSGTANGAFAKANIANTTAEASYAWGNTINVFAQSAFTQANTANITGEAAFAKANVANTTAEAGFAKANVANTTAEAGFAKANVANTTAEAAFNKANSTLSLTGGTISGNVTANSFIANTSIYSPVVYSTGALSRLELSDIGLAAIVVAGQTYQFGASGLESNQGIFGGTFGGNRLSLNSETNLISNRLDTVKIQTGTTGNIDNEFVFANNSLSVPGRITAISANITSTNTSTSNITGAITVSGGVGVKGNVSVDGIIFSDSTRQTTSPAASINVTNTTAEAGFAKANLANVLAQAAFTQANTANVTGEAAFAKANVANTTAEAGFAKANNSGLIAQAAYDHANTRFASAGGTITGGVSVTGNIVPTAANTYYLGSAASPWQSVYVGPNSLYIGDIKFSSIGGKLQLENATDIVLSGSSLPNTSVISTTANAAFDKANVANTTAEAAYAWANTVNVFTSSAYATANVANTTAEAAFAKANVANTTAEAGFAKANAVLTYAGSAYGLANTTAVIAQAAYDNSNTKFNSSGGTITGAVTISGTNNLTVSGNLIVQGTTFSSNSTTFEVNDPLILLGVGNYYSDTRDIGFAAHYNDGTNAHSGLIRDAGTKEYFFFKGYTPEISANDNVDIAHATFATANVHAGKITANVVANTVTLDNGLRTSNTYTTAANTATVPVDSFLTGTYRSAKYQAQMTAGTNYQAIELLLIHDGTTANLVQYADVVTSTSLGTFDASITTGVLRLLFTPATATETTIKLIRDTINV
jgi:hypothetical protein